MPNRPSRKHLVCFVRYAQGECDRIDGQLGGPEAVRALEAQYGRLRAFEESTPVALKRKVLLDCQ